MKVARPKAGQVWVTKDKATRTRSRRVIEVLQGKVCYSTGGKATRWCQVRAFRLWTNRYQAVVTRVGRKRSLVLRNSVAR